MKLSSSNLALATLALSPSLLSSPVFAAPTPDVGGLSPNPSTGYFADSPQPQAVDSPVLQGTPTFGGAPTWTGTPPASKIAGRRRSIGRRSSARFRAAEPTLGTPGLGLGLGIGLFGPSVRIRAASPFDPGSESFTSEGLLASATTAATSATPALVKPEGSFDGPNPPSSSMVPAWLDRHDTLPENLLGDPSSMLAYPQAGREGSVATTEYRYPQHDARDTRLPLMVKGLESPFLNSPVPHDSPTFPPAIHKRQSVSIPSVGGLPLVGSMPDAVPGMVVSGAVPLTGLPSTLGPNGFPISVPNLDTLPLRNLGGTGILPSTTPLGSVSSLPGTAGISVPDVPNVDGLPLVGGVSGMVSSVSNGLGLNGLPLSGVPSQLGTVGQVLGPVTYPLAVLGENPYAVHGLTDPASKLLAELSPHHLQQTGSSVVESGSGRLVQGVQGVVPGVGAVEPVAGLVPAPAPGTGPSGVSLPGAVSGVNLPGGVPGTNLPSGIPGLGPLPSVGTLPVSSILPVFGSTPPLVPTVNQLNQAATVPGVLPDPLAAVPGVVPIPTGNGVLGGQSVGLGGVAGTAPGLVPGVGTLPVSAPVPVPGVDSLLVPSSGQLGPAAAPFAAIPGSLGPAPQGVDVPVVSEVVGANGAIPGLVGVVPGIVPASVSAPGLIPTSASVPSLIPASVSTPSLTGTPFPELLPTEGDLGVPVVDSPSAVTDKDVVGVYKATGGMGAMGRPDEEVQVNGWKDGNGAGKDGKEVEMKEKYVDGNDGQGKTTSEPSSSTVKMADPPHTLSTTSSGTHSWATPTTAASLAPSGTMAWPKDGTPVRSASVTESPSTRPQMVKQATPMPVAESLTAWAGLGRRASPVPDAVPTSFSIGVPPAHAIVAPLSITTSATSAPPSPVDNSNSSASSGSDDGSALPATIVTGSTHPVPMYHGGSPLSRAPEISPGRLAPAVDATGMMMDALPSMSGTVNPTESLRRGVGPPKMTTSVMRAATPTASAPAHGQTN